MKSISLALIVMILVWGSCDLVNPEEKVPTYVRIDSFGFTPAAYAGTSSQKITSAWVFFDNETIGVFDLPATVPLLIDKPGKLTIRPGVTYSGLSDYQVSYPFFLSDTLSITPQQGNVINFTPTTTYLDEDVLSFWMEDFEFGNTFTTTTSSDTALNRVNDPGLVFEGVNSGYIYLRAPQQISEVLATTAFTAVPESYLELNYRSSIPFQVGLQSTNNSGQPFIQYVINFRPRAEWNKVYIGLQDFINTFQNREYRVAVRAFFDGQTEGFVSLDNFKVVTKK